MLTERMAVGEVTRGRTDVGTPVLLRVRVRDRLEEGERGEKRGVGMLVTVGVDKGTPGPMHLSVTRPLPPGPFEAPPLLAPPALEDNRVAIPTPV